MEEVRKRAQLLMVLAILIVLAAIAGFVQVVKASIRKGQNDISLALGGAKIVDDAPLSALLNAFQQNLHRIAEYQSIVAKNARFSAIGEVAAQFQHDLRGPIHTLEIATNASKPSPELSAAAKKAVGRIRMMLAEMKNFSGAFRLEITSALDLSGLIRDVGNEFALQFPVIRLEVDVPKSIKTAGDALALARVFSNLLNNAVEARSEKIRIEAKNAGSDGLVHIKIHDWGRGFTTDAKGEIGHAFATKNKEEGTGLGLWHASRVLEAMGGNLEVLSPGLDGAATTVVLRLQASTHS
jgi:signal transduction histidine kinase